MKELLLSLIYLSVYCSASIEQPSIADVSPDDLVEQYINDAITIFETAAGIATKSERENVVTQDEIKNNYEGMVSALNTLVEKVNSATDVYAFVKHNGLKRIVYPYLSDSHAEIKAHVLKLVKTLFNVAPTTLSATASAKMVDKLLEIFQNEENKIVKENVLDVLSIWLPNNPNVQARLMKIHGLEILYEEIPKLDMSLIHSMLKLFTNIVKEHVKVRNSQKSETDKLKLKNYQKVGLLDKLSTSNVCKALLDIFDNAFQFYEENKEEIFGPILELVKATEEFCFEHFKKHKKSLNVFENFLSYVKNLQNNKNADYDTKENVDMHEIEQILTGYVENLQFQKNVKEEF